MPILTKIYKKEKVLFYVRKNICSTYTEMVNKENIKDIEKFLS